MIEYFIQQKIIPYLDRKCATSSKFSPFILQLKWVSPKHPSDILSQISITIYISYAKIICITCTQEYYAKGQTNIPHSITPFLAKWYSVEGSALIYPE